MLFDFLVVYLRNFCENMYDVCEIMYVHSKFV
jgi:hypothetical protein